MPASKSAAKKSTQAFPPSRRILATEDFKAFFDNPVVVRPPSRDWVLFLIPNDLGHFRLGATLKVRDGAVERNQIKRFLRDYFRRHETLLGSYDYNFVVSRTGGKGEAFHRFLTRMKLFFNDGSFEKLLKQRLSGAR